jgi:hypothetical protein
VAKNQLFCYNQGIMVAFFAAIAGILAALIPGVASAQIDTCPLWDLSCAADANTYLATTIIPAARIAFGGILLGMFIFYALKLLLTSYNESSVGEVSKAYLYAFFGTAFFFFAGLVADSFTTLGAPAAPEFLTGSLILGEVMRTLVAAALLFNIAYQGVRLVLQPDENAREKAKKRLIEGAFGVVFVVLAGQLVATTSERDISIAKTEGIGIANFLVTIFGALAVFMIVVGGIMLVMSYDDSFKDKAKKYILAGFVTLLLVIASYALVTWFI